MKFFASVYFAIILIALTVLFVIIGTFLESWTGSHLYAAYFTYQSPVFQLLIFLYFLNILLATLKRFPFKKRHFPFVLTHIGLLLLLAGVFGKSVWGVQGSMGIAEGSCTNRIFLPNTYALLVEDQTKQHVLELKKTMHTDKLSITLLEWNDHAQERFEGFIKGGLGHLLGLPPFEVDGPELKTTHYAIRALSGSPESVTFPGKAALFFLRDKEKKEHLVAFNESGERFDHTFENQSFLVFDKGFGGYGVYAQLPDHFPSIELIAPLTRATKALQPHRKKEELTPRIRLLISDESHSEVLTLTYDKFATGFKWPALNGKYLIRFQSLEKTIPHYIRLREARQINYIGTTQPYSFESDLLVDEKETTISMNHVYEKNGYRFYLANLVSPQWGAKRAQIVVNYDPVKYYLTYPGAIVLALGMLLLYLQKRYG